MKTFRYLIAGLLLLAALPSQSKEEEISVSRSWGKLSGTLTVPDEGSDAAVLIIAGSGPTDRNGNSGSGLITNTYYMLARALEKEGIASLRYDKQGIGGSRYRDPELYKQEDRLRLADYIADAEALTDYLKERGFRKSSLPGTAKVRSSHWSQRPNRPTSRPSSRWREPATRSTKSCNSSLPAN